MLLEHVMKFGLIDGRRVVAEPGLKGAICPRCHTELIAKCGEIRVKHWAHKNRLQCDDWMEQDNEWRSRWLDAFPPQWQEVVIEHEEESHFADLQTPQNTIILLHQSHLTAEMIRIREAFYQTPVWLINAGRYKLDVNRLLRGCEKAWIRGFGQQGPENLKVIHNDHAAKVFGEQWLQARFPVFFDYSEAKDDDNSYGYGYMLDYVWCLMPYRIQGLKVLYRYKKEKFIELLSRRKGHTASEMRVMEGRFRRQYPQVAELAKRWII